MKKKKSNKKREGSCLCGKNKFYTIKDPIRTLACYCRYCQLRTGSIFGVTYWFKETQLKFKKKYLKSYTFKTESGNKFKTFSCKECSSSICWTVSHLKNQIAVAPGMYNKPSFWFKIEKEIFNRSKPKFLKNFTKTRFLSNLTYKPIKKDPKYLQG
jgi:hypothetical protein